MFMRSMEKFRTPRGSSASDRLYAASWKASASALEASAGGSASVHGASAGMSSKNVCATHE